MRVPPKILLRSYQFFGLKSALEQNHRISIQSNMGKKRKAGGRPAANKASKDEPHKFDIEERFDDSEDEFQAGRDQILLDEAPEAKRRRRLAEEGVLDAALSSAMGDIANLGAFRGRTAII